MPPLVPGPSSPSLSRTEEAVANRIDRSSPSDPSSPPACPCDLASLARVPFRLERGRFRPLAAVPLTLTLSHGGERGLFWWLCGISLVVEFFEFGEDDGGVGAVGDVFADVLVGDFSVCVDDEYGGCGYAVVV